MTESNDASGYVSNGPTSSAGASGGESSPALLTSRCGNAQIADDGLERGRERGAVGDVHVVLTASLRHRAGRDVEAGHLHPALGETLDEDTAELTGAAGHDRDAPLEVEQRIAHAACARFALQTASQNSRTQPCPPARVRTIAASGITSAQASDGTTGRPTTARHSASLMSFPT